MNQYNRKCIECEIENTDISSYKNYNGILYCKECYEKHIPVLLNNLKDDIKYSTNAYIYQKKVVDKIPFCYIK